jgi:hypothetical protein
MYRSRGTSKAVKVLAAAEIVLIEVVRVLVEVVRVLV